MIQVRYIIYKYISSLLSFFSVLCAKGSFAPSNLHLLCIH